jgi:flagellar biosynthesis/type III secretory pathway protein FliH
MSDTFSSFRGSGVLLFDDFDVPAPSPEPEVIEPMFTGTELIAAREEAEQAGRAAALAEIDASMRAASRLALTEITEQINAARAEVALIAEQSAEALTRLLLGCFATAFPALSDRHGPAETAAVLREILPALHHEPKITVRVNPLLVQALTEEFLSFDSDLAARLRLVPTAAVALGDARIAWENGAATRDTASLWKRIEAVLAPAGLLKPADAPGPAEPGREPPHRAKPLDTSPTAKEHDLVE